MASTLHSQPVPDQQPQATVVADKITNTYYLFVHPYDTPGSVLIPMKLTDSENYSMWRCSTTIILQVKRKLEFVNDICKKSQFSEDLHENGETCNVIVLSCLMNTVFPNLFSGIVYYFNAHLVWKDLKERFDKVNQV